MINFVDWVFEILFWVSIYLSSRNKLQKQLTIMNIEETKRSGIGDPLLKKLNKIYTPSSRVDEIFKGNDITFITNSLGEPVTLYIGKRGGNGNIKGTTFWALCWFLDQIPQKWILFGSSTFH